MRRGRRAEAGDLRRRARGAECGCEDCAAVGRVWRGREADEVGRRQIGGAEGGGRAKAEKEEREALVGRRRRRERERSRPEGWKEEAGRRRGRRRGGAREGSRLGLSSREPALLYPL